MTPQEEAGAKPGTKEEVADKVKEEETTDREEEMAGKTEEPTERERERKRRQEPEEQKLDETNS